MVSDVTLSEDLTDDEWLAEIEGFGQRAGYARRLGRDHTAVYSARTQAVLVVSFDAVAAARASNPAGLPHVLELTEGLGYAHLALFSKRPTWFRADEVYAFFDDLVDEAFFDGFDQVIFFGVGPGGYAAAAYSVAAPGATVIAVAPQATLDPAVAGWDDRFTPFRRLSFTDRYGYAPDMLDAADAAYVIHDPEVELDAMHAALFRRPNVTQVRFRHAGTGIGRELIAMGALRPLIAGAAAGTLTDLQVYKALRARHNYLPYLRNLLTRVHAEERHLLTALLCRAVLRRKQTPRFEHHLELALQKLAAEGRTLPEPRRAAQA